MRIELVVDGGVAYLPGLARPFVIDTDSLAADEASRLSALVESSGVLRRGARDRETGSAGGRRGPAAEGGADARSYRITVDDGSRRRTLRLRDPLPPRLAPLVEFLRRRQREGRRSTNGAGGGGHGDE
jgi:hypothetical protein